MLALNRIAERLAKKNAGVKEALSNRSDAFKATYQQKLQEILDKESDDFYPDAWLVFVFQGRPAGENGLAFLNYGRLIARRQLSPPKVILSKPPQLLNKFAVWEVPPELEDVLSTTVSAASLLLAVQLP